MHDLIVIGAGPAGLSAAIHAQLSGLDVLLIEKGKLANTVFEFQRHKHVMAEPAMIPLRSDVPFQASTREVLLERWNAMILKNGVRVRCPEEVKSVVRTSQGFSVMTDSAEYESRHVVIAIGIQGNPRKLGVPGERLPHVSLQLVDPSLYQNEDILMVGAGDAAIEGVLALCGNNRVVVVNRNTEFIRLKDVLDRELSEKISSGQVIAYHNAKVERIEEGQTFLKLPDRLAKVKADRVFVRIGAEIPRPFLEKVGIAFASTDPQAPPILSERYETSIPGLFMIGAVAGYNLIKQGLNQGFDVVEHILGRPVQPVDEPLLKDRLRVLRGSLDERLTFISSQVSLLAGISKQVLRELILESALHEFQEGSVVFRENDYSDSFYCILRGRVDVTFDAQTQRDRPITLVTGECLGEMSLLSGRRRSGTVVTTAHTLLLETPRKAMLRLMTVEPSVRRAIDEVFMIRAFRTHLLPNANADFLLALAKKATLCTFKSGEIVFRQDDMGDAFHLVRNGSVKISKRSKSGGKEVVVSYVSAGHYFGEMALLDPAKPRRTATITATKYTETIRLGKEDFESMLVQYPAFEKQIRDNAQKALVRGQEVALREVAGGHMINELMKEGVFEGTDVLLIDETKCIRCDQCVNACASTHNGQTRLYRTEGIIFADLLVPTSCRHCENPLCLTDCLAGDAILRDPKGEVFIRDNCIGCGNCAKNCPYGNILMVHEKKQVELGPLDRIRIMLGLQPAPAEEEGPSKAVKCDLCRGTSHGPACVRICPTGAAFRVSPEEYFKRVGVGAL